MKENPWIKSEKEFYNKKIYKKITKELDFSKTQSALDYGAGTGGFASILAKSNPKIKITAIDSNPEAITLGKKYYSDLQNLKFILAKKIPKEKYNLIFINLTLHELNKKGDEKTINSFLKTAHNQLKKQGSLSILDNIMISKSKFRKIYEKNKDPNKKSFDKEYQEHNKYTKENWEAMFKKAGFHTEKISEISPNLFHYIGKITSLNNSKLHKPTLPAKQ